jgi:hypothetical protein
LILKHHPDIAEYPLIMRAVQFIVPDCVSDISDLDKCAGKEKKLTGKMVSGPFIVF